MPISGHPQACRLLGVAILVLVTSACGGPDTLIAGNVAFVNVDVLPMDGARVLEEQAVIIEDGRIVDIAVSTRSVRKRGLRSSRGTTSIFSRV